MLSGMEIDMSTSCVVAVNSPFDHMILYGPFNCKSDAEEWAEHIQGDCWVVELYDPD